MRPAQTTRMPVPETNPAHKKSPSHEGLFIQREPASGHLNDGLHDGALSGDGLGVCLVVALRLDQIDQFVGLETALRANRDHPRI